MGRRTAHAHANMVIKITATTTAMSAGDTGDCIDLRKKDPLLGTIDDG